MSHGKAVLNKQTYISKGDPQHKFIEYNSRFPTDVNLIAGIKTSCMKFNPFASKCMEDTR